jgi:cytochrome c oxidase cbb3-type subunit 3
MSSRCRIELILPALLALAACDRGVPGGEPQQQPGRQGVITSDQFPGLGHPVVSTDPRAAKYLNNAAAVITGMKLYKAYNCNGCHSNGGGGMGPSLMDGTWIYGSRLEQIHQTLVEGRPNGMPAWAGKIPDEQMWQIAAYVRSMSLPETLAAQQGGTPSQSPAPLPASVQDTSGWAQPADSTTDYGTTMAGR